MTTDCPRTGESAPSVTSRTAPTAQKVVSEPGKNRQDSRETSKRRPACKRDPEFGPVCTCGGAKAKQAWTCQRCHGRLRGYGLVPRDEQMRRAGRKYRGGYTVVVGDEDAALIARADALTAARSSVGGELAALVAEQTQDDRFGTYSRDRWVLSLDDTDQYGRPLYELIAA